MREAALGRAAAPPGALGPRCARALSARGLRLARSRRLRARSGGGGAALAAALLLAAAGCKVERLPAPAGDVARYAPRTRYVTITAVPLLTKEMRKVYPFLTRDFAKGGVLAGKEVYAFSPSTITAVAGDTLRLTLINPEDDDHDFVTSDLFVRLPPQSTVDTTYVVRRPGIIPFTCSVPAHVPMMHGAIIVLAAAAIGG